MNTFEKMLLNFGPAVFAKCFHIMKTVENYEYCLEMSKIANKYALDLDTSLETWQANFWRLGLSGQTAVGNAQSYLSLALEQIGYSYDDLLPYLRLS